MTKPFRFGVQLSQPLNDLSWADTARKVEELGYSTLTVPDHFGDQLAPVPALMAAAAATTTLRVGALVFGNDYKHPVVLAKEMATIDVLSGGRLEFGLGAGWMNTDYIQSGIDHDRAGIRIERLEESLAVCKALFGPGAVDFDGAHYHIDGLDGLPKPVQNPPPVLIGGGGKRMLGVAARHADIVGINPAIPAGEVTAETAKDAMPDAIERKISWVAEAAGDRFADIELNLLVLAGMITDDQGGTAELLAQMFGATAAEMLATPHALFGTVDEVCDQITEARERFGFSYFVFSTDAIEAMAPVVARLAGS